MAKAKGPRTTKPKTDKTDKKVLQMPEVVAGNGATDRAPSSDLEHTIRLRAYQLYQERGYVDGQAEEDWFTAEREIRARNAHKHSA